MTAQNTPSSERIRALVLAQYPLTPALRLANVLAAGVEREAFPPWWDPRICFGSRWKALSGFLLRSTTRVITKGHTYQVTAVRFPPREHGREAAAVVVFQDTLDGSHNVALTVRKRDITPPATPTSGVRIHGRPSWDVSRSADLSLVSTGPYYWP